MTHEPRTACKAGLNHGLTSSRATKLRRKSLRTACRTIIYIASKINFTSRESCALLPSVSPYTPVDFVTFAVAPSALDSPPPSKPQQQTTKLFTSDTCSAREHLQKRADVPAVGQQRRGAARVRSDPHLRVRLVDSYLVRLVPGSLQARHHALVARLTPSIFLPRKTAQNMRASRGMWLTWTAI